jgi:hypothetical protein
MGGWIRQRGALSITAKLLFNPYLFIHKESCVARASKGRQHTVRHPRGFTVVYKFVHCAVCDQVQPNPYTDKNHHYTHSRARRRQPYLSQPN